MHTRNERVGRTPQLVGICVAICLLGTGIARADLINATINTDVPLKLEGTVDNMKLEFANATFKPAPTNWLVQITQSNFDADPAKANNDFKVLVRHLVGPHPGEAANPTAVVAYLYNVTPGMAAGPKTVGVKHGIHQDVLEIKYVALDGGRGSQLVFKATHMEIQAPEPSALLLLASGTLLLGGRGAWRRRSRRSSAQTSPQDGSFGMERCSADPTSCG